MPMPIASPEAAIAPAIPVAVAFRLGLSESALAVGLLCESKVGLRGFRPHTLRLLPDVLSATLYILAASELSGTSRLLEMGGRGGAALYLLETDVFGGPPGNSDEVGEVVRTPSSVTVTLGGSGGGGLPCLLGMGNEGTDAARSCLLPFVESLRERGVSGVRSLPLLAFFDSERRGLRLRLRSRPLSFPVERSSVSVCEREDDSVGLRTSCEGVLRRLPADLGLTSERSDIWASEKVVRVVAGVGVVSPTSSTAVTEPFVFVERGEPRSDVEGTRFAEPFPLMDFSRMFPGPSENVGGDRVESPSLISEP